MLYPASPFLKKIRKALKLSQAKLSEKLGIKRVTYRSYEAGTRGIANLNADVYEKFKIKLGIDLYRSISKGKGSQIFIVDPTKLLRDEIARLLKAGGCICQIPVFNTTVTAGVLSVHKDEHIAPAFFLPIDMYPGGAFGVCVTGNSMDPAIQAGDHVICRELPSVTDVINGKAHLVTTHENEEMLKITYYNKAQQTLLLKSVNPAHSPKTVTVDNIRRIYRIVGIHRPGEGSISSSLL